MIFLDENKLTYDSIISIGADYGIKGLDELFGVLNKEEEEFMLKIIEGVKEDCLKEFLGQLSKETLEKIKEELNI